MATTKNIFLKHFINILMIVLGCFIMGTAFNVFYEPNNILLGGFGGIATIISNLLERINIHISISLIYLVINAIIYILAVKTLGKTFAIYAMIGILAYSLSLEICKFPSISNDLLLCSIYGGVICGIGIGLVIKYGGSTGGDDMLGCIVNHKKPTLSVGWVTIIVNTFVIIVSLFVYGLNLSLYSIISIFISGKTADLITEGPKSVRSFFIISSNPNEICLRLMNEIHRGATSFEAYGKFSGNRLEVIMCLISSHQVQLLKQIVYDVDPNAFLFSVSVKEAIGNGFHKLETRKKFTFHSKKTRNVSKECHLQSLENSSTSSIDLLNNETNKDNYASEELPLSKLNKSKNKKFKKANYNKFNKDTNNQ